MKDKINLQAPDTYSRIVIDDPIDFMNKNTDFDYSVTWPSLVHYPIYRLAKEDCLLIFLSYPEHTHLAMDLIKHWTFQAIGQTAVRMEDGHIRPAILAKKGDIENPFVPTFDKPYRYRDLFTLDRGIGVALFTHLVYQNWDWWEPENFESVVDLWYFPFKPKEGMTVNENAVILANQAKEALIAKHMSYWQIGDAITEMRLMNLKTAEIQKELAKTGLSFSDRHINSIAKLAKKIPHPIRDYSKDFFDETKKVKKTTVR
jgi:hypothetical protein